MEISCAEISFYWHLLTLLALLTQSKLLKNPLPTSFGLCYDDHLRSSAKDSHIWAVTHLVSLSLFWNQDARFTDGFTLDQFKFGSIKRHWLTLYFCIVDAIFISLVSVLVQPPIWQTRILMVPSSLSCGKSHSCATLYRLIFLHGCHLSIPHS